MILSTLQTWASQFAGDPSQTRYSASQLLNALNEAQVQFCLDTRALFKDKIYSVIAGQNNYPLPSDFMLEKKATISSDSSSTAGIELEPITRGQIEFFSRNTDWTENTGSPRYFMIDPAVASGYNGAFVLYPNPQGADAGTNNCYLTYFPYPTLLANPTDVPLNGTANLQQFHMGLAAYAAWLLLGAEVATPEMVQKMSKLWKQYQDQYTQALDKYGNTASAPMRLTGGRLWR